jgi:isoamylase
LILFNSFDGGVEFNLPARDKGGAWTMLLDTKQASGVPTSSTLEVETKLILSPRSMMVLT